MPYQYEPLREGEIRLLVLEPAFSVDDNSITCYLRHVFLDDTPDYEALSYVWGDPSHIIQVACAGQEINTTVNLHSALRHLRYTDKVRVLWADAICINQCDLEERSQQVLLMAEIYRKADEVLIWLGEETEDVKSSFESILVAQSFFPPSDFQANDEADLRQKILEVTEALSDIGAPNLFNYDWNPLISLLLRPWFQRKWVIQELAHARDATLVIGKMSQRWDVLADLVSYMGFFGLPPQFADIIKMTGFNLHFTPINHIMIMHKIREHPENTMPRIGLLDLLGATRNFGCFDPKDQVIAVLSLAEDVGQEILPNYKISTEDFFKEVARWIIGKEKSIRLLSLISDRAGSSLVSLPSWIPDFSCLGNRVPLGGDQDVHFQACGDSLQVHVRFSHNNNALILNGILADQVHILAPCPLDIPLDSPANSDDDVILKQETNWIRQCHSIASECSPGMSAADREEAFCRAMLCDRTHQGRQAPAEYSAYFAEFLRSFDFYRLALDGRLEDAELNQSREDNYAALSAVELSVNRFAASRRFCITREGRMGQVPREAEIGDLVCIFEGGRVPFVLRARGEGAFSLIGESYVHGIMQGEAVNGRAETLRDFTIL